MTKMAFLLALHDKLSGVLGEEVEEHLRFYSEMIEDRMEDGLSEAEAVAQVGSVDEIAAQILADSLLVEGVQETWKPKRRMKVWEIILLALGSPVWAALLIAAFAVTLSLYVSFWAVIISLWAAFAALSVCALAGVVACVGFISVGQTPIGLVWLGGGMVCAGLAIFLFFGCKAATKGAFVLAKKCVFGMKNRFRKKEA